MAESKEIRLPVSVRVVEWNPCARSAARVAENLDVLLSATEFFVFSASWSEDSGRVEMKTMMSLMDGTEVPTTVVKLPDKRIRKIVQDRDNARFFPLVYFADRFVGTAMQFLSWLRIATDICKGDARQVRAKLIRFCNDVAGLYACRAAVEDRHMAGLRESSVEYTVSELTRNAMWGAMSHLIDETSKRLPHSRYVARLAESAEVDMSVVRRDYLKMSVFKDMPTVVRDSAAPAPGPDARVGEVPAEPRPLSHAPQHPAMLSKKKRAARRRKRREKKQARAAASAASATAAEIASRPLGDMFTGCYLRSMLNPLLFRGDTRFMDDNDIANEIVRRRFDNTFLERMRAAVAELRPSRDDDAACKNALERLRTLVHDTEMLKKAYWAPVAKPGLNRHPPPPASQDLTAPVSTVPLATSAPDAKATIMADFMNFHTISIAPACFAHVGH